jgi:hypothetical protein
MAWAATSPLGPPWPTSARSAVASKRGFFEGDFLAIELSVNDGERFPGRRAYFSRSPPGQPASACSAAGGRMPRSR